jgi:archaellum biogenesis ATPase FlaH
MKINSPHVVVTKVLTGIQGFDEVTDGGLPRGRTTLVMGGPGCGKTVFALQSLVTGANRRKEAGIFVAFEEGTRQIVANAATFGWDLPALAKKKLFFLDAQLSPEVVKAGEFDLVGMLNVLQAKAEEIEAKWIVFDVVPGVNANEARLGQVFLNLVVNAAQAMQEGRAEYNEIRVTTRLADERVIIEVSDTGAGIPPEIIGRIFDAFFTTKSVGVGTGLGLAICHRIVTDMGGELTV